ncbi:Protein STRICTOSIDINE SYNTHASE-LIKE 10 [Linum perenne]
MDSISSKQLLFIFIFISLISNLGSILCDIANYTLAQFALPPGVVGPESLAFDCNGEGPYVGVSDGRILKWNPGRQTQWIEFAVAPHSRDRAACDGKSDPSLEPKCGRPLGLKFNPKTCDLYIADAYFGLMATGPDGGLAVKLVSSSSDGVPFKFTNGLDVDPVTGVVYFTDSSLVYQRKDYVQIVVNNDQTGRLFSYDPKTRNLTLLAAQLSFPNGVALSEDSSLLVIAETSARKIIYYPLNLSIPSPRVLTTPLPAFPDNIRRSAIGIDQFWVGLNTNMKEVNGHDDDLLPDPVAVKLNNHGNTVETVDGGGGDDLDSVSEVVEDGNGGLWFGSVTKNYVGYIAKR